MKKQIIKKIASKMATSKGALAKAEKGEKQHTGKKKKPRLTGSLSLVGRGRGGTAMHTVAVKRGVTEVSKHSKIMEKEGLTPKLERFRNTKYTANYYRLNPKSE